VIQHDARPLQRLVAVIGLTNRPGAHGGASDEWLWRPASNFDPLGAR
jgi:hypothetical protein